MAESSTTNYDLNDDDYQNMLATIVLCLQAETAERSPENNEPWRRLPPTGLLIERLGKLRETKSFGSIAPDDAKDVLCRLSTLLRLQTLEPSVVATLGKLSSKLDNVCVTAEEQEVKPQ